MKKITEKFIASPLTFSCEFFPPKTPDGRAALYEKAGALAAAGADFFSVTCGAGGGTKEFTDEVASALQKKFPAPVMRHLVCAGQSEAEIRSALDDAVSAGVQNIMALRGDAPAACPADARPGHFVYARDLVRFIRDNYGDYFSVGVAGYPDGHPDCPDVETGAAHLKEKIDAGADFIVTQFFFDNAKYFDYVALLRRIGVTARVIPGVLPITNYAKLLSFCEKCKVAVPRAIREKFDPFAADPSAVFAAGVELAAKQCEGLLTGGSDGIHIFTMNQAVPAAEIIKKLRRRPTEKRRGVLAGA